MDRGDFVKSVRRSWEIWWAAGIGESFSNPAPLSVNTEFRRIALSEESTYERLYLKGIEVSHYNFLLSDYSYFQFSAMGDDEVRYAFFPNPFIPTGGDGLTEIVQAQELLSTGEIDLDEYLAILGDARGDPRIPPIRYEHSPRQHQGLAHPCAHFHIGHHAENRWAVSRFLTPLAFNLLILKHYYGPSWISHGADNADPHGNRLESMLIEERTNCRIIPDTLFLEHEARSFHFA